MKTRTFTRLFVLLLALVLCLSGLAAGGAVTAQAAEGDALKSFMVEVKWSGWSSGRNLTLMSGYTHEVVTGWNVHCSFDNQDITNCKVCYCIEPGVHTHSGLGYTEKDESWFDLNAGKFNDTIDYDTLKEHLGRIMQYGYIGGVDFGWGTNPNAYRSQITQYIATQLLVWEVIVGERDANFNHVTVPGGCDRVLDLINNHPWQQDIVAAYQSIEISVKIHAGKPSFLADKASDAQTVTLKWDGSKYSATLTDTNNVLGNFTFSASGGVSCTVSGNTLTLSSTNAPSGPVTVTGTKTTKRKGVVVWYSPSGYQSKISYSQEVDDPLWGYVKVEAEQKGTAQIVKNTTNGGSKAGWHFVLKDPSGNTMGPYVTDASGVITLDLVPGTYTVTETDGPATYWVNDPQPTKTVTVVAGQTATVTFTNKWNGRAKIVKQLANPEAGSLEGWPFTVKNSSGGTVGTYTTNASGEIVLDLEPGTYTVTENIPENSIWECPDGITQTVTVKAGETATVTYTNALRPGKITAHKAGSDGSNLAGATFLLEWSQDGTAWQPVVKSAAMTMGGCQSEGLEDGCLTTDDGGSVTFEGLYPTLRYRLTEVKAPEGHELSYQVLFEGQLEPEHNFELSGTVTDDLVVLPMTGSYDFWLLPVAVVGVVASAYCLVTSRKRKTH